MYCSNQSPLALRATAVNAKQPRHEVRVSTWLSEFDAMHLVFSFINPMQLYIYGTWMFSFRDCG